MASAPPAAPPLPISTSQTSQSAPSQATITTTPAFLAFISRLSDSVRHSLSLRRPWLELLDRSSLSHPDSLSNAAARICKNASYFRINYLLLLASVLALSLLSHPFSLLLLLLLSAWIFLFLFLFRPSEPPLILFGRTFSDREILASLVVLTVVAVFLTSVGSLIISALMVGLAIVAAHGAFRMPEDLFLFEETRFGSSVSGVLLQGVAGGLDFLQYLVFEDAYKSQLSIVILDDIERKRRPRPMTYTLSSWVACSSSLLLVLLVE